MRYKKEIKLFNTFINKDLALKYINEIFENTFLNEGYLVEKFEKELKKHFNFKNCVAVNSGTSALHLTLKKCGIKEGDEVILPAQTFIATGLAILYLKAKPVFADIDYLSGNIEYKSIEEKITDKTRAIIMVHWGGMPSEVFKICQIASSKKIFVVDDCAQALGAKYFGKYIGNSSSNYSCFSFQSIKHLTTADGGLITYQNSYDRELIKNRWFGIDRDLDKPGILGERQYNLENIGYKYHMNNYDACLGLANLKGITKRIQHRISIAKYYHKHLQNIDGIHLFNYFKNEDVMSSFWLYGLHVIKDRTNFIKMLKSKGIEASVVHLGIDKNKIFGGLQPELYSQRLFDQTQVNIPIHENVTLEDAEYIVDCIKKGW